MALANYNIKTDYGFSAPLNSVFPSPIVAKRAPTVNDISYQIGQIWVYKAANSSYILTSVVGGVASWNSVSGTSATFSNLTVSPGPISLTGAFTLVAGSNAVQIGNDAASHAFTAGSLTGASAMTLQGGTSGISLNTSATGVINLGLASMSGIISIGKSTVGQTVNISTSSAGNIINLNAPITNLAGIPLLVGSGAPADALGTAIGALYINSAAASAATRLYICTVASGAGRWTNITCAA
jgi:hypothetical protein